MANIHILDDRLIEKIAAGEVVERPASIVKELVENAVDAQAKIITIDIQVGGKKRILISDDGCGIVPEELPMAIRRHATSKITSADDLFSIHTMGFRGEALAAIAAISHMRIISKSRNDDRLEGACLKIDGGIIPSNDVHACAEGTEICIEDVFYNVPARQKFLKSDKVESGHIVDTVQSLALVHAHVQFKLTIDNKEKLHKMGSVQLDHPYDKLKHHVQSILGNKYQNSLISLDDGIPDMHICGYFSQDGRRGGKDMHVFINNRPIKDRIITHALTNAFGHDQALSRHPACALWISMNPELVDVNVHPAKREVRFQKPSMVHDIMSQVLKKAISSHATINSSEANVSASLSPNMTNRSDSDAINCNQNSVQNAIYGYEKKRLNATQSLNRCWQPKSPSTQKTESSIPELSVMNSNEDSNKHVNANDSKNIEIKPSVQASLDMPVSKLRVIGQLNNTYIICEHVDQSMCVIDQHAAHEQLGYQQLMTSYKSNDIAVQQLLIPEQVELSLKSVAYIQEALPLFEKAGFEMEPFGDNTFLIKAVPAILGAIDLAPVIEKIADELEALDVSHALEEKLTHIFSSIACHAQIRGGDRLSMQEMQQLIVDMESNQITHCPHGRPVTVMIAKSDIEKLFKRRA